MNYQWQTLTFAQLGQARLYAVLRLRQEVFAVEQQSIYLDLDGLDQQAIHMLCTRDEELLAYQRCLPPGLSYPESSLGRIVVCPATRGLHLGEQMVQRGIIATRQLAKRQYTWLRAEADCRWLFDDEAPLDQALCWPETTR